MKTWKDVTPAYSRSGGRVLTDGEVFKVPYMDQLFPGGIFPTLAEAWSYCEAAYYSWN